MNGYRRPCRSDATSSRSASAVRCALQVVQRHRLAMHQAVHRIGSPVSRRSATRSFTRPLCEGVKAACSDRHVGRRSPTSPEWRLTEASKWPSMRRHGGVGVRLSWIARAMAQMPLDRSWPSALPRCVVQGARATQWDGATSISGPNEPTICTNRALWLASAMALCRAMSWRVTCRHVFRRPGGHRVRQADDPRRLLRRCARSRARAADRSSMVRRTSQISGTVIWAVSTACSSEVAITEPSMAPTARAQPLPAIQLTAAPPRPRSASRITARLTPSSPAKPSLAGRAVADPTRSDLVADLVGDHTHGRCTGEPSPVPPCLVAGRSMITAESASRLDAGVPDSGRR